MTAARDASPVVSCIDIDVPHGTRHQGLPSDLYAITVYCDDELRCSEEGEDFVPEVTVSAMRTRPGQFTSSGRGQLAIALLAPEAMTAVLRAPLEGLVDCRVPLAQLCGMGAQRGLRDRLRTAASTSERAHRFQHWIGERMGARSPLSPAQRRVSRATQLMAQPTAELTTVASTVGASLRQLERDFDHWLGVSPSHFMRLTRFQRAVKSIAEGGSLADTAIDCGFSDQPHLTRSVRRLGGETPRFFGRDSSAPRAVLADRLLISGPPGVVFGSAGPTARGEAHLVARAAQA
ncbi:AraC family transcriptional regulator [Piscinibacter sp. HJYY11]|uniref:AraC family transcriptional regulator n=1 Tax=Piscinibacter sp. HJYY11 TaxID=2801333 RepID=UPI00191EEEA5|nr:AraC family transcriptional regulator [Piscinibacter sp. HJYY11]MBL0727287.1 helix-turn-helix transcriptional regulator [Piscinibacter sp. HJYY11]